MKGQFKELSFGSHNVEVMIEGIRLERLLEKAMGEGLTLKSIRVINSTTMTCRISGKELKKLRRLAGHLYRITIRKERGPGPSLRSFFRRPLLVTGSLLILGLVTLQSFFIREIRIEGYRAIPEEKLYQCLEEVGIYEWAFRPKIDWTEAKETLYDTFPEITWVQLGYRGRLVVLNLSETTSDVIEEGEAGDTIELIEKDVYVDIVAEEAGYVERILPYYGKALVEQGDYVEKGQILITGKVPLEPTTFEENAPTEYFVKAKGTVWATVPYRLIFRQERYLFGESEGGLVLNRVEKTDQEAERKLEQQIRLWAKENLAESAEILNKSLKFSRDGNIIEVCVTLEVRREIGTNREERIGKTNTDNR